MSIERDDERRVRQEIDQVFQETFGMSTRGRIQLAAYAIGNQVGILRGLIQERDDLHTAVPPAPPQGVSIFTFGFTAVVVPNEQSGNTEKSEESDMMELLRPLYVDDELTEAFDPIERATLARDAALEGARATYNLSQRQAKRALRLAERTFWLFNVADPSAK